MSRIEGHAKGRYKGREIMPPVTGHYVEKPYWPSVSAYWFFVKAISEIDWEDPEIKKEYEEFLKEREAARA